MEGALSALILLFVLVSIWAFSTWRKFREMEKLNGWVTWSVHEDDFVRSNIPLWVHLRDAQIKAKIRDAYKITEDEEWESAAEIIARYQTVLSKSYFDGRLWPLPCLDTFRSIYEITDKDYFIFMLYIYLCENDNHGQTPVLYLRGNAAESRNIVFYKMKYITYMYCKGHPALQKNVPAWMDGVIKDDLTKAINM